MASAKGGTTTRRSSSSRSSKKQQEPEVSPARWAGVALVIAAIVGAIFLAVVSPSDPNQPGTQVADVQSTPLSSGPSPSPSPTAVDVPVPVAAPEIVIPSDGKRTGEYEFAVTVAVPDDRTVARKLLDLHIYNNGQHAETSDRPRPGTEVKVDGIRLVPGENSLTAFLSSPAGPGPTSEPIMVVLDEEIPELAITTPKRKWQTYEESVLVEVASEIGASVTILNEANDHDVEVEIGPSGNASKVIRLKRGKNTIVATSVDDAGQDQDDKVIVTRLDGRPTIKLKAPESFDPPGEIRIVAEVTDAEEKPMKDAQVSFMLTAPNQSTIDETGSTNANGRAVWEPQISGSSSPAEALEVVVTVISPSGDKDTKSRKIALQ